MPEWWRIGLPIIGVAMAPITKFRVNEKSSAKYTATIVDEAGSPVPSATLQTLSLWLYDDTTKTIINSRGEYAGAGQDVLTPGTHGVTIHPTDGTLTWDMTPEDNACVGSDDPEIHYAVFKGSWLNGARGFTHRVELIVANLGPAV
jgi:hypothetical protein